MSLSIPAESLQYVKLPVSAIVGGTAHDPTGDRVQIAFTMLGADPNDEDWNSADWETVGSKFYARCLVGPGGTIDLTVPECKDSQTYAVWLKVTDNPEIPIIRAGTLVVF